jgi:hypothetical protein
LFSSIKPSKGEIVKFLLHNFASSACLGFLLILPLFAMEIVNRRKYNEDFPIVLFFGMWESVCAISIILLPLAQARWPGKHGMMSSDLKLGSMLLANPKSSAVVSIVIFLALGIITLLASLGWAPIQTLINGPNSGQDYVPGLLISTGIFWLAVAAAIIANAPVVRTLQTEGRLFAHKINILIIILFVFFLAIGLTGLILDQWPCFMGVQMCD